MLYAWWQLYRMCGEAAFVPTQTILSPPEVDRPQNAQEHIAHLELDLLRLEVDVLKKDWH